MNPFVRGGSGLVLADEATAWAEQHHAQAGDRQAGGPDTNAHRQDRSATR